MKAWIISDQHYAPFVAAFTPDMPEADICICAGDVCADIDMAFRNLRKIARFMPVIYVAGNHEYHGQDIETVIERARVLASETRIHFLENEFVEIDGIRFIGATLWTDLECPTGEGDEDWSPDMRLSVAMADIEKAALDFKEIYADRQHSRFIKPIDWRHRHLSSREYISQAITTADADTKCVVVSHHSPLTLSLDPAFDGNLTNATYASDLSDLIREDQPTAWIHGHVHKFRQYTFENTQIVCNPRGFINERDRNGFQPQFVMEL